MNKNSIKTKINELKRELMHHSYRYYQLCDPEISDYEYDMMMKELEKLEEQYPEFATSDSPTKKVGR